MNDQAVAKQELRGVNASELGVSRLAFVFGPVAQVVRAHA